MPTELQPRLDDEVARRAWRAMFDKAQALGLMAPMAARSLLELAALCALLGAALQEVVDLITILGALRALSGGRGEARMARAISSPRSSPSAPASLPANAARDGDR